MNIEINRNQYEFSHGKLPRGTGCWGFNLGRNGAWTEFWANASFTEALKAAKREARSQGCTCIVVLP